MTTTIHLSRAYGALKDLFALIGIAAVALFLLLPAQQELAAGERIAAAPSEPPAADEKAAGTPIEAAVPVQTAAAEETTQQREQRAVTAFIARRYRVSEQAVGSFVSVAYRAGEQHSINPLLILAVMAIESRYNPVAKSLMGAKGLMQVIPRFHLEKLADHGGERALLQPDVNILVGTRILREYMDRFRETETALQMYAGALDEPTSRYAKKVFAEKARLEAALSRKTGKQQSA